MRQSTPIRSRSRDRPRGLGGMQRWPVPRTVALLLAVRFFVAAGPVLADVRPQVMDGVPLLPIPTYEEVGLPPFTMPTGTPSAGTDTPPGDTGTSAGDGTATDGADSAAMAAMMSRSWGEVAAANAETVGVTRVSVASTCTIEAGGCQTLTRAGSISGTFQMRDDTYTAMINSALARNPGLAGKIDTGLAGKLDPANQSIAAAEYLRQGAEYLQAHQISSPTVLDVRGYYNFGPGNAVSIAQADDSALMSSQVSGLTAAQFKANGIDPAATTVGQWRASVVAKIGGSAANAPVLLTRS